MSCLILFAILAYNLANKMSLLRQITYQYFPLFCYKMYKKMLKDNVYLDQHNPHLFSNVVIILQFIVGILFKTNSDFLLFLTSNLLACKSGTTLMVGIRKVEEIKHLFCVSRHPCKFLGFLPHIFLLVRAFIFA